jgi:hypothetical protein
MKDPKCFTVSLKNERFVREQIETGQAKEATGFNFPLGIAILSHHKIPDTEFLAFGTMEAARKFIGALDILDYEKTKKMFTGSAQ